jgi:hypothetical protein
MAWPIPPVAGVNYNVARNIDFVKQFYQARREKYLAIGHQRFPRDNETWDEGAITAITSTTATIGGKTWTTDQWVGYVSVGLPHKPANYDLIFDSDCPQDPRTVIRVAISGNDTTGTLTISATDLAHAITERRAPTQASLVGRPGRIIGRDLLTWADRWIEYPNDEVLCHGIVSSNPDTPPVNGTIISTGVTPIPGVNLVGKDILFWNDSIVLQRGTVASFVGNTFTFTGTTGAAVAGADFVVVNPGAFFGWPAPGTPPKPGSIRADYRGMMDPYFSHDADDVRRAMFKPRLTFQSFEGLDPTSCPTEPTTIPVFDVDYWTDVLEACVEADHSYAPDIHKTFRHLWVGQSQELDHWVNPDINYDGADSIPELNVATWFKCAGINSQTVTGGTVSSGHLPYMITAPYLPIDIFFSVQDSKGNPILFGEATYTGSGDTLGTTFTSENNGASIVVSLGPTRYVRQSFQRMRPKTVLIPGIVDGALAWPPTEDAPGEYVTRAASTHYLRADQNNFVGESALAIDAFTAGDLARYVGDNFCDPSIEPHTPSGDDEPRIGNYERFFTGTRKAAYEASLAALRSGKATSGTLRQLTCADLNWWGGDFYDDGQIFTRTGTATGGSTTTLIDSTQSGSSFWNSTTRSQVGLVVTVTLAGVDHKRLITSHSGTTIGFTEALPSSASGAVYAIRETDAETNRYKSRTLTLSKPDPSGGSALTAMVMIASNDDSTLFFTADCDFEVDETTTFSIAADPRTGGTWKWDGAAWIVPTGTDSRNSLPFPADQTIIPPTVAVRYGWPRLGDYVVTQNWIELYNALNKLKKTKVGATLNNRLDPDVPEANFTSASGLTGVATCLHYPEGTANPAEQDVPECSLNPDTGLPDYTLMHDEVEMANHRFDRLALTQTVESVGPPMARYSIQRNYPAASGTPNIYGDKPASDEEAEIEMQWSRLFTTRAKAGCGNWTAPIKWYCYSLIDEADHDQGSSGDGYDLYEFEPGPEPLQYRKWAEVDSVSSSPDTAYHSRKIGGGDGPTLVHPGAPSFPPDDDPAPVDADTAGPNIIHYGGFYVSNVTAIVDWSGTFTYL